MREKIPLTVLNILSAYKSMHDDFEAKKIQVTEKLTSEDVKKNNRLTYLQSVIVRNLAIAIRYSLDLDKVSGEAILTLQSLSENGQLFLDRISKGEFCGSSSPLYDYSTKTPEQNRLDIVIQQLSDTKS